jgi:histidinol-phosphate aminotransferase
MNLPDRINRLPAYIPMEPVEAVAARLGIDAGQVVKLDANENPYGPSPKARQALADLNYVHFYPDAESRALRNGLADFTGAPVENLFAGAGADELIDVLVRVLIEPGDRALVCPPTFDMYRFYTMTHSGRIVETAVREDFGLDVAAIQDAAEREQPKVIFVSNPNNPTGVLATADEIDALLALPALVVLDEAYIEFTDAGGRLGERLTRIREVAGRENMVVLRTFSKWAGLAGLRIGYGAFPGWLVPGLWKAKPPYNVNAAATPAALATLDDLEYMAEQVARIRAERSRLYERLCQVAFLKPFPSQGNFILCEVLGRSAAEVQAQLLAQGILVRAYANRALPNHVRISAGRPQDTDRLMQVLEETL